MTNILFVSIAFPPKSDPECIQTGRFFKYLNRHDDLNIEVLTSADPTLFMPLDHSLDHLIDSKYDLTEIRLFENKYISHIIRKLGMSKVLWPESKMTFHWQWKKAAGKVKNKPDLIYSRSFPLSSSIMALKLKKHYKIPWVAHLSDPWTLSPLHNKGDVDSDRHKQAEKELFENADALCFTSAETVELYKEEYPQHAHKLHVFPNVFDPNKIPSRKTSDNKKKRIVYTGGLAGTRSARMILEVLNEINTSDSEKSNQFEALFAGDMDRANRADFDKYQSQNIKHLGKLSSEKALELQGEADLLLVIDSKIADPKKNVFMPSKLLDYALLEKPILALSGLESTSAKFLNEVGGVVFDFDDKEGLKKWFLNWIDGNVSIESKKIPERYSAEFQSKNLKDLFHKVLKKD